MVSFEIHKNELSNIGIGNCSWFVFFCFCSEASLFFCSSIWWFSSFYLIILWSGGLFFHYFQYFIVENWTFLFFWFSILCCRGWVFFCFREHCVISLSVFDKSFVSLGAVGDLPGEMLTFSVLVVSYKLGTLVTDLNLLAPNLHASGTLVMNFLNKWFLILLWHLKVVNCSSLLIDCR